jgi:hypothetical protein
MVLELPLKLDTNNQSTERVENHQEKKANVTDVPVHEVKENACHH